MSDILLHDSVVGEAIAETAGLYYKFVCKCRFPERKMYEVHVSCDGRTVNLGICVPVGDAFEIRTSVPVKRLGTGELRFSAVPKDEKPDESFYPVREDAPFDAIDQLDQARLLEQDGQTGIIISEDQSDNSSPMGQWSEPRISE